MGDSLLRWVKDRLHSILGMSDSSIAQFLVRQAETDSSADAIATSLSSDGFDVDSDMRSFLDDLYQRVSST